MKKLNIMSDAGMTNFAKGVAAEDLAARYLTDKGYVILAQRYKTKFGEIDLIAQKGDVLHFIEVKTRQTQEEALYSITPRAQRRIEQSALYFLSTHPRYNDCAMQFDVIAISAPFEILHLDNAWVTSS